MGKKDLLGSPSGTSCAPQLRLNLQQHRIHLCVADTFIFKSHALCASHREQHFIKIIQSVWARNSYMNQISLYYHTLKKDWRDQAAAFSMWRQIIWSQDIVKERSRFGQLNSILEILSAAAWYFNNEHAETEKKRNWKILRIILGWSGLSSLKKFHSIWSPLVGRIIFAWLLNENVYFVPVSRKDYNATLSKLPKYFTN